MAYSSYGNETMTANEFLSHISEVAKAQGVERPIHPLSCGVAYSELRMGESAIERVVQDDQSIARSVGAPDGTAVARVEWVRGHPKRKRISWVLIMPDGYAIEESAYRRVCMDAGLSVVK